MKPFTPDDMASFMELGQLTARGNAACCVVRSVNLASDSYSSSLWRFALDCSDARALTTGDAEDQSPAWSPDGSSLAFISPRKGSPQVQLLPAAGGESHPVSEFAEGAGSFQWSPDGSRMVTMNAMSLDVESRGAMRPSKEPTKAGVPELAWRLPYKADGIGFLLQRKFQLHVLDPTTRAATPLAHGPYDVFAFCWSPDGRQVAFTRTREGPTAHQVDLYIVDVDSGNVRCICNELASLMTPKWSPDGKLIAFTGARDDGDAQSRLYLHDVASGTNKQLGSDDMEIATPEGVHWREDSQALYVIQADRACQHIVLVNVPSGTATKIVSGERHIAEMALAKDHIVYFSESAVAPRELYCCRRDGSEERQLSYLNQWWWDRTPLEAKIRSFEVPDGKGGTETIEGWLVRAKGSRGPQPLMMEAHGGPNAFALLGFPWNTYWNALCSMGWAVVVPHAVGSTSFGREFGERINGHWGEMDFPQFMAVLDALQADGTTDDRVVIAGKSYGGFMSAWAIGHTDRFKAAVVAAPVGNLESHFGTSDGGYHSQPYALSAERHIDPQRYRELSPVNYIHKCKTPTLLLQGKEDERCPRGQAEELFAVLVRTAKVPAELVMYPDGGHHLFETGKPSHRLDVVRRMIDWVTRWTARPAPSLPQADTRAGTRTPA